MHQAPQKLMQKAQQGCLCGEVYKSRNGSQGRFGEWGSKSLMPHVGWAWFAPCLVDQVQGSADDGGPHTGTVQYSIVLFCTLLYSTNAV